MTLAKLRRLFLRVTGVAPTRDDVRLRSDEPIEEVRDDYFGFAAFATALAEIVDNPRTATPLTVALSAPWGAGKTSVAAMMQGLLRRWVADRGGERPRVVCWFNAWEHDDAPHLGAALAAAVAQTADQYRRFWWRIFQPLPAAMLGPQERWRRLLVLTFATILVAGALAWVHPTRELSERVLNLDAGVIGGVGWLGVLWVGAVIWRLVFSVTRDAAKFIDEPGSEAAKGSMVEVKDQLGRLIHQARRGGRMVIFVDDLERCPKSRAVEVFEVASQLLAHPGVVTVLLADMRSLSSAAGAVYGGDTADPKLGRRYLEKLVQLELELPPPAGRDMKLLLRGEPPSSVLEEELDSEDRASLTRRGSIEVEDWIVRGFMFGWLVGFLVMVLNGEDLLNPKVEYLLAFGAVGAMFATLLGMVISWYGRARRRETDRLIRGALGSQPRAPLAAEDEERLQKAIERSKVGAYAIKEAESYLTNQSLETAAVERYLEQYPPRFPRGAKRMLNHARLLTKIARERGMFGGSPELTPAHLGKWIVLKERWPEAADAIASKYGEIEDEGDLRGACGDAISEPELEELIRADPPLAPVLERLIHFAPAVGAPLPAAADLRTLSSS